MGQNQDSSDEIVGCLPIVDGIRLAKGLNPSVAAVEFIILEVIRTTNEFDLKELVSTAGKRQVMTLFHRNPGLIATLNGLSLMVGESPSDIEKDVEELMRIGILEGHTVGGSEVISLNRERDSEIQEAIATKVKESQAMA